MDDEAELQFARATRLFGVARRISYVACTIFLLTAIGFFARIFYPFPWLYVGWLWVPGLIGLGMAQWNLHKAKKALNSAVWLTRYPRS